MNKILLTLLVFITTLLSCNDVQKSTDILTETNTNMELKDLIGNTYEFKYLKSSYNIRIQSDSTIYWKLVGGNMEDGSEGSNKYIHSQINDNILFISWIEDSGLELYNVLNFEDHTLTTHGNMNGQMFVNQGTFRPVE